MASELVRDLVVSPLTWILAIPATVAAWFGLSPLLSFIVDTSGTWFTLAAISGSTLIPQLPAAPDGLGTTIVVVAAVAYATIQVGRLLGEGLKRLK